MKLAMVLSAAQATVGATLTAGPEGAARIAAGPGPRPPASVVRFLGLRMVVQALVVAAVMAWRPGVSGREAGHREGMGSGPVNLRKVLLAGAAIDASHAASMVPLAIWKPAYRRSVGISAGLAAVSAGVGVLAARGARS